MATINLSAAEKQVEAAKLKLQQATNRLRTLNAKERAKEQAQDRKNRNRRLILTGAVIWERAAKDEAFHSQLMGWLDSGLPDNRNRVIFDLALKPEGENSGKPIGGGESGSTLGQ